MTLRGPTSAGKWIATAVRPGGPINATRVMQFYIFQKAFAQGQFGYASALSVILFIILASVALFQLKVLNAGESDLA